MDAATVSPQSASFAPMKICEAICKKQETRPAHPVKSPKEITIGEREKLTLLDIHSF